MKKILVVDDEAYNRDILRKILTKEAFTVEEASNGAEALELLKQTAYDLVLLDLRMPVMDGYEAIEAIRTELHNPVSIIVISANIDSLTQERLASFKVANYINKPYQLHTLLSIIHKEIY